MNTATTSERAKQAHDVYLQGFLQQWESQKVAFPSDKHDWLRTLRQEAAQKVLQSRMPTRKDEDWRFTDLAQLAQINFELAQQVQVAPEEIQKLIIPEATGSRIVFVNGLYAPELSDLSALGEGVYVGNLNELPDAQSKDIVKYLAQQQGAEEVFTALNTSALTDVAVIWAQANVVVEAPIHLLFLSVATEVPTIAQPRTVVVAQRGSSLQLVEHYGAVASEGSYLTNAVTEIWLEENAEVNQVRVQEETETGFQIGKTAVAQKRDSRYTCTEINLGGKISRHDLDIYQIGEQTDTRLNGLTMVGGEQLSDTHSLISLTKPSGTTDQLHKCIVSDRAHAVFNGKVLVPQAAQLTNADQLNRNLLLSSKARVDTKPELQITADNVKCSHGATVSSLEPDELFYLRSRGLNETQARNLLIDAFAAEIIERIPLESLRQKLTQLVASRAD